MRKVLDKHRLHTICREAACPNISECWSARTATFLLMGDTCTRNCRFCSVNSGIPGEFPDKNEPDNIANAVKEMGLKYTVLTSVTRDDLYDGGAGHYAETVKKIKKFDKKIKVEALIPDFQGKSSALEKIIRSGTDVIAHNIETVRDLTPEIRDIKADYDLSLKILRDIKEIKPAILTKSSLLLGFKETECQVKAALRDLKKQNIDIVVIGQYLSPSKNQVPVKEYIRPEIFSRYEDYCRQIGITGVIASPLARTSFRAHSLLPDKE